MGFEEVSRMAPVSITLLGFIVIIILSQSFKEMILKIVILLISFVILLLINTLYFKWYNKKR